MSGEEYSTRQDNRLQKILFLLKRRDHVTVNELSTLFSVSKVTIRTDLAELERQGLVLRNYGGASLVPEGNAGSKGRAAARWTGEAASLAPGPGAMSVESCSIARLAVGLIGEGDAVFLDSSPEAEIMAEFLRTRTGITVLTSSIKVALTLSGQSGIVTYLIGGRVANGGSLVPDERFVWPFRNSGVTRAFIGAWGASGEDGFSDSRRDEAALKREVLGRACERYILLRSSRWGIGSLCPFAPLDSVDAVLTDAGAHSSMIDMLGALNVRVIRASSASRMQTAYERFHALGEDASEGLPFQGSPGKGRRLAFANGNRAEPFCGLVEASVLRNAALAGFSEENILVLDNEYDPDRAVGNVLEAVRWGADVVIEFNTDVRSNNRIADILRNAGIAVIAVEGAVPSAPFVGANNWQAGSMAGDYALTLIRSRLGGWEAVDGIILVEMSVAGELVLLRTEAFAASLEAVFGEEAEERIIRIEGGNRYGSSREAVAAAAGRLKKNGRFVLTAVNAEAMNGAVDALTGCGIWSPDRFVSIVHGEESTVQAQLSKGIVDAAVLYHPDRYGDSALPAACAVLEGAAVPPYMYIDSSLVLPGARSRV